MEKRGVLPEEKDPQRSVELDQKSVGDDDLSRLTEKVAECSGKCGKCKQVESSSQS